jgi:hypothetical protein
MIEAKEKETKELTLNDIPAVEIARHLGQRIMRRAKRQLRLSE